MLSILSASMSPLKNAGRTCQLLQKKKFDTSMWVMCFTSSSFDKEIPSGQKKLSPKVFVVVVI